MRYDAISRAITVPVIFWFIPPTKPTSVKVTSVATASVIAAVAQPELAMEERIPPKSEPLCKRLKSNSLFFTYIPPGKLEKKRADEV